VGYSAARKKLFMRDMRDDIRARSVRRTRRTRAFTIIELLVVITIIGITVLISAVEVNKASQRAKLVGAANDLRTFLARAVTEMQRVRCLNVGCTSTAQYETFVEIGAQATDGSTPVRIYTDDNANGLLDIGTDNVVAKYTIPSGIILAPGVAPAPVDCLYGGTGCTASTTAKTQVASLNWGAESLATTDLDKDDKTTPRALRLDFKQRAIATVCPASLVGCTASTTLISGIAKLALTHNNMTISGVGRLTPLTSYEVWISPVWSVTLHKKVWDGTKFVDMAG
jgi:prepilin-type N-terminal cleavage/methylation domain-containing protein